MNMKLTVPILLSQQDVSQLGAVGKAMTAALGELAEGKTSVRLPTQALAAMAALLRCHTNTPEEAHIRGLVTDAGGVFIGREELIKLGEIPAYTEIPAVPIKYGAYFLQVDHPLRDGIIASHVILAFDPRGNQWLCIDRGNGGRSDIIPGSLGENGAGLPGLRQDQIIEKIVVNGVKLRSPEDGFAVKRVLDNALAMHSNAREFVETTPFADLWVRTNDTVRGAPDYRLLIGATSVAGVGVKILYPSEQANFDVGLIGCWS